MLRESVCNPAQAALPTDLRAHLEARIASGALELPILPHVASQVLALSTSDDANARARAITTSNASSVATVAVAVAPIARAAASKSAPCAVAVCWPPVVP